MKGKKGKRIRTLEQLDQVAQAKRSVIMCNTARSKPAAFMMNMQARNVLEFIRRGLYLYELPRTWTTPEGETPWPELGDDWETESLTRKDPLPRQQEPPEGQSEGG